MKTKNTAHRDKKRSLCAETGVGKLFCGVRMFGEGDSLIALGLGAIFGWKSLIIVIIMSILN